MKFALGSDHRGVGVKRRILKFLKDRGYEVVDLGTDGDESVDYPDFAFKVAKMVSAGEAERGILICGTGLGMSIAANKFDGVRAASVHDDITAEISRRHTDCNVLCLSADLLGERLIDHIVDVWVKTEFDGGRHARRINKIAEYEKNHKDS